MQIFVLPGAPTCDNLGDLGMLQVALERLRRLWPEARLSVLTRDPVGLRQACPGVEAVPWRGRNRWLRLRALPQWAFSEIRPAARCRFPISVRRGLWLGLLLVPTPRQQMRQFAAALFNADLVVLSGCGLLADPFAHNARQMLDTLGAAQRAGIPTALLSQGLGPMTDPGLRSRAAAVLPHAGKIFLREPRAGLALLRLWGVAQTKIAVTGDDTVELAFNERPGALGSKIGVNLRLANYAGADLSLLEPVRQVLRAQAHQRKTSLLGLPITRQGPCSDVRTLGELLGGLPPTMAEVVHVQTPLELIRRVAECRVVITGSYHAAVFALAQGIPAVALAQSAYYRDKFCGLAELFGSGCEVLSPDMPSFNAALNAAVQAAWEQAPALRPRLLAAAQNQIQAAQQAYQQLPALLSAPSGLPAA